MLRTSSAWSIEVLTSNSVWPTKAPNKFSWRLPISNASKYCVCPDLISSSSAAGTAEKRAEPVNKGNEIHRREPPQTPDLTNSLHELCQLCF